jgi:hypothetical protein
MPIFIPSGPPIHNSLSRTLFSLPSLFVVGLPLQGMTAHYLIEDCYKVTDKSTVLVHAGAGGMGQVRGRREKCRGEGNRERERERERKGEREKGRKVKETVTHGKDHCRFSVNSALEGLSFFPSPSPD